MVYSLKKVNNNRIFSNLTVRSRRFPGVTGGLSKAISNNGFIVTKDRYATTISTASLTFRLTKSRQGKILRRSVASRVGDQWTNFAVNIDRNRGVFLIPRASALTVRQ